MNKQTPSRQQIYSKEISSKFTKIICDLESLQRKIISSSHGYSGVKEINIAQYQTNN